ncbi:MAG TPA: hypothetical protein VF650_00970 [Allosphingosinicella sp.]|jgi:hypothetical protein
MSGRARIEALLAAAGAAALLAGCATKPETAPAPVRPAPVVRPPAPPAPATTGLPGPDLPDPPLTPGDWSYSGDSGGSVARFGTEGAASFSLRCDPGRRRIVVAREGSGAALRVRTTYGQRALPAGSELPADDPLLDDMAFSRGRFTVEADGLPPLTMPTWPEPARVVEDCRG